jgi:hypothetical protein
MIDTAIDMKIKIKEGNYWTLHDNLRNLTPEDAINILNDKYTHKRKKKGVFKIAGEGLDELLK